MTHYRLLKIDDDGSWKSNADNVLSIAPQSDDLIKNEVVKNIQMAKESYIRTEFGKAFGSFIIFPIPKSKIKDLIDQINELTTRLIDESDEGGPYEEIYSLTSVLFPFSN